MKSAVVVYTKVPKEGETKTRLTEERGGIFTPKEAKEFYEAMLLDVIDSCLTANSGDLYICYNQNGDENYLRRLIRSTAEPEAIRGIFKDQGGTFDQGMQFAFDTILRANPRLAEAAIIVGGDCPCLQPTTVREAVKKLEGVAFQEDGVGAAIVESIDQAGGFNLIGYSHTTPFSFDGVFYNPDGITALDMIAIKAAEKNIPLCLVEMVTDVDLPDDIASLIPVLNTLSLAEKSDPAIVPPKRTLQFMRDFGFRTLATAVQYTAVRS